MEAWGTKFTEERKRCALAFRRTSIRISDSVSLKKDIKIKLADIDKNIPATYTIGINILQ